MSSDDSVIDPYSSEENKMSEKKNSPVLIGLIISIVLNILLVLVLVFYPIFGFQTASIPADLPPEFNTMTEAWAVINNDYIDKEELDATKLSEGAVRGMVIALGDKYSAYLDPEVHTLEMSSIKGKFYGIGAYVGSKDNRLVIIAPMNGSPAEEAGLLPGDQIIEIDGEDTMDLSVTEAALIIQGPEGTDVILTILREDEEKPFEVTITRKEITLKSAFWEIKDNVAYISLIGFAENTTSELMEALQEAKANNVEGIVLDLRNNGGGLLNIAVDVTSQFLEKGIVVKAVNNKGEEGFEPVKAGGIATDIPLVVLVNGGSASASEVVAGALQDYERAKLIGQQTFGKGSVQVIRTLSDGSSIHMTTARWLTPTGRTIDGVGLQPDLYSELEGDELTDFAINYLTGDMKINPSYE
jgi:carboxyl-terminal processing protease